jgi:hypothetical protein
VSGLRDTVGLEELGQNATSSGTVTPPAPTNCQARSPDATLQRRGDIALKTMRDDDDVKTMERGGCLHRTSLPG